MPDSLVALWVDIVCIQCDVGQLPPQALGFDFLKGCFANKVSGLDTHRHKQCFIRLFVVELEIMKIWKYVLQE